jgi:hypothetical protein
MDLKQKKIEPEIKKVKNNIKNGVSKNDVSKNDVRDKKQKAVLLIKNKMKTLKDELRKLDPENRTLINAYRLDYYYKNKDTLEAPTECECGLIITKGHLKRHRLTQRHNVQMTLKSTSNPVLPTMLVN